MTVSVGCLGEMVDLEGYENEISSEYITCREHVMISRAVITEAAGGILYMVLLPATKFSICTLWSLCVFRKISLDEEN